MNILRAQEMNFISSVLYLFNLYQIFPRIRESKQWKNLIVSTRKDNTRK